MFLSTRTAALEQEIENLKKKLVASTRDNLNLQEELSEAYRIKVRIGLPIKLSSMFPIHILICFLTCQSQLADLHGAEVTKVSLVSILFLSPGGDFWQLLILFDSLYPRTWKLRSSLSFFKAVLLRLLLSEIIL